MQLREEQVSSCQAVIGNFRRIIIIIITITKRAIVMRTVSEMQKTILMDSESIIRKFISGQVQGVEEET